MVPMVLTIGDTPPTDVAVLFFEALITGATLQPSNPMKPAVKVLFTPVEVEFGHLQTDRAFLNLANVMPDTYNSITLTFENATLTIENHSGGMFGSCANNSACELTPTFNPSMVTVSSAPFPITITQNSVVALKLDFDVNSSVQPGLSTINPTVAITSLIQRDESEGAQEVEKVDEVDGVVTAVGNNQLTLMNEHSGQSFNISVDANTVFQDFDRAGCTVSPANLSCVKMGQILDVDLSASGMGATLAKRIEFEEDANREAIKGIITSVDSTTQFHMVAFNEEPAMAGISEGSPVVVMIQLEFCKRCRPAGRSGRANTTRDCFDERKRYNAHDRFSAPVAFTNHRQRHERRREHGHVHSDGALASVHGRDAIGHNDYRGDAVRHAGHGRRQFRVRVAGRWQLRVGEGLALQHAGNTNAGDANDAPAAGRLRQIPHPFGMTA
jgi:hypothetical protein